MRHFTIITLLIASAAWTSARPWVDAASKKSVEGDLLDVEGRHAIIKTTDGVLRLPIKRLDRASQAVIVKFTADRESEDKEKAAPFKWNTDFNAACKQATKEKKTVLLNFTGSDWCFWCGKLRTEVFSTKEFQDYASVHFVLVEVDFPEGKELDESLATQNLELQRKYGVTQYPTIILCDGEGKTLGTTGYRTGGPEKYLKHLRSLLDKAKKKRN